MNVVVIPFVTECDGAIWIFYNVFIHFLLNWSVFFGLRLL